MQKSCGLIFVAGLVAFIAFFIYMRYREGVSSLMIAAKHGKAREVKRLIDNGAELDRQSAYGWTALMFASWEGREKCVRILLDAGANPNIRSDEVPSRFETTSGHPPTTALREAISHGYPKIARLLIDAKAEIDPVAVALAAREGQLELLKLFKSKGVEINKPSGSAFNPSPLITSSAKGHLETVRWLVKQGADPNRVISGDTALTEAIENDQSKVVKLLLENGADPNLVCGWTDGTQEGALFTAVTKVTHDHAYAENIAIVEMLLKHGAKTDQRGFGGDYSTLEFLQKKIASGEEGLREAKDDEDVKRESESLAHLNTVLKLLENQMEIEKTNNK